MRETCGRNVAAHPKSDPLLAVQRYGLGRTAAFTSVSPRWGKDWLQWAEFSQFAAQLVRGSSARGRRRGFDVRVHLREGQGIVESDIYDAHGRFMNNLEIGASAAAK